MGILISQLSVESGCRGVGGLQNSGRLAEAVNHIQQHEGAGGISSVGKDARRRILCIHMRPTAIVHQTCPGVVVRK